jgi:hypothetical protein
MENKVHSINYPTTFNDLKHLFYRFHSLIFMDKKSLSNQKKLYLFTALLQKHLSPSNISLQNDLLAQGEINETKLPRYAIIIL